jgi:hypothetical protein
MINRAKTYKVKFEIELAVEASPDGDGPDIHSVTVNGHEISALLSSCELDSLRWQVDSLMEKESRDQAESLRDYRTDQAIDEAKGG